MRGTRVTPDQAARLLGVAPWATPDEVRRAADARLAEAGADEQRRAAVTTARDVLLATAGRPPAPAPPAAAPWYPPPAAPRRRLSTGAIVGITLGSIAAVLVVLLVAVVALVSIAHTAARLADARPSATAAPFDIPSGPPSGEADAPADPGANDYDVDGVHVHYVDGWTFELTPGQTCAGATVTAGFADTPDGDTLDEWTTTLDLQAGVPVTLTIPDDASTYDYAGIDAIDCAQA